MPQLKVKGIEVGKLCKISTSMIDELQELLQCPRNYFIIENVNSTFIMDGGTVNGYPVVEISWFDRGQEIQDKVAKIVTDYVHNIGYSDVDIIFYVLDEKRYYENGKHF